MSHQRVKTESSLSGMREVDIFGSRSCFIHFSVCPSVTDSKSYYDAMDPNNMSIPLRLRGKRDVVFGNLLEIFNFHDK